MYKILIVEDDETISGIIKEHLTTWGYECRTIENFHEIMEEFTEFNPHLVLLDINIPFYDGFYWCREIRKHSKVPITFISSMSDNMSVVMAMNMGGDDFICKPFDMSMLTAKVNALIRRTYDFKEAQDVIAFGGVILDKGNTTLSFNEEVIELTKNEYKIIQILMENKGEIISREELMECLWNTNCFVDDSALTVTMARLRKKLGDIGAKDYIVTKRGIGYQVKANEI